MLCSLFNKSLKPCCHNCWILSCFIACIIGLICSLSIFNVPVLSLLVVTLGRMNLLRCIITGNGEAGYMFLGRPWGPFGRVVFAHTFMDRCIKPAGWHNWDKSENERTACFYEFRYWNHQNSVTSLIWLININLAWCYIKKEVSYCLCPK